MKDEMSLSLANSEAVDVVNVTPHFKLCCEDRALCTLCMAIDLEMKINQETSKEQLEYSEDTNNTKGNVWNAHVCDQIKEEAADKSD